jgi:hypothetical protein
MRPLDTKPSEAPLPSRLSTRAAKAQIARQVAARSQGDPWTATRALLARGWTRAAADLALADAGERVAA